MQINVCPKDYQYHDYGGGIYDYLDSQLSTQFSWINYPGIVNIMDDKTSIRDSISGNSFPMDKNLQKSYIEKFLVDLDKSSTKIMNIIFNHHEQS